MESTEPCQGAFVVKERRILSKKGNPVAKLQLNASQPSAHTAKFGEKGYLDVCVKSCAEGALPLGNALHKA